ncbi:pentapeptide repeat-containing protein [Saccharothrix sp. BKS2]|uniref:WD40 domain-containing protein n=1 Tax=Saccharothrix sp. BKS2 TaxID=3064400 RepID=UPI0039EBA733
MPDGSLPTSVVRVLDPGGDPVGGGVVVGGRVLTCAHVVNLALGLDARSAEPPGGGVRVDFPALDHPPVTARVASWTPPPPREGVPGGDVAALALDLPAGVTPARLIRTPPHPGSPVDVFGHPADRPDGAWVRAVVRGPVGGRLVQLDSDSALRVRRGYSGSAVWDPATGRVVGIIATSAGPDSYAIGADALRPPKPEVRPGGDGVVVLHLTRVPGADLGEFEDLRPDLVVFTGHLTANGRPDEFARAFRSLADLAEAVDLPRRRVVVVPGSRDVNRMACRAYFTHEEAWGRTPTPPYWPKWGPFKEAFDEFYGGAFTFTPDEPWTLFEYQDPPLVVAGLNATVEVTHEVDRAALGDRQAAWFGRALRDAGGRHLCAAQGLTRPDGWGPGPWLTDAATDRPWSVTTLAVRAPLPPAEDVGGPGTFFDRVLEATRVAHPTATVTPRPDEGYVRVSKPRDSGGFEQWPVGVAGVLTPEVVDRFVRRVHDPFAAADPYVPSEVVHGGPPAPVDLVLAARRRGVRLRSFVEYQGLLDLRPLAVKQAQSLAGDTVYPAGLYVSQRYAVVRPDERGDDLLGRVLDWLREESARFVVVLGDFGRGKSFLLRQLTRVLPEEDPGLLPVLVELRSLEKAPSLDELLAQHLVREGVPAVDVPKLRYMISSGRLALLFDGFDELELRVGYDNAADYLTTLLQAVTDRAKVVLTSRTQHFRSTDQVLNALGQQVSALAAGRVVVLEDFTDDQIRGFLTRHYGGDGQRAARRFELLDAVGDLLGLSRNPRMLSFIADLDEERLLEVRQQHGRVSAAELYRELLDSWMFREVDRQDHRHGVRSFDRDERVSACRALALRLWETTATTIQTADLEDTVVRVLTRLAERGYSIDQAAHAVGSGSLLVRAEDGGFAFVHQSVMEWLVAEVAADELRAGRFGSAVVNRRMTRLMVDFLCDLAGREPVVRWARQVLVDPHVADAARQNATEVVRRLNVWTRLLLSGQDLRGYHFGEVDLSGADLREADLSDQRFVNTRFVGADLTDANLTGARVIGGDLTDAVLTGSRWRRAALLGVVGADRPELADAAVSGRDPARALVHAEADDVAAVAFSPDGELLALAREHVVELRHVKSNQPVRLWRRHAHRVTDVAWSPDGRRLATREEDGRAYTWDAATGDLLGEAATGVARLLGFRYRGRGIAVLTPGSEVRFLDAAGAHQGSLPGRWVEAACATTADLLVTRSGTEVVGWSLDSGTRTVLADFPVRRMALSPDGGWLALDRVDRVVVVELRTNAVVAEFATPDAPDRMVLSPGGAQLAVISGDGLVRLVAPGGQHLGHLNRPPLHLGSVSYSADGRRLLVIANGLCWVWDLSTGEVTTKLGERTRAALFAPDDRGIVLGDDSGVLVPEAGSLPTGPVVALGQPEDRGQLVTASAEREVTWWDLDTGQPLRSLSRGTEAITAIDCAPTGDLVAIAHGRFVTIHGSEHHVVLRGRGTRVRQVAFSPDGELVAVASDDGTAQLWTVRGDPLLVLEGHEGQVWDVAFWPDGGRLVTASSDGTARVWSRNGGVLVVLVGHTGPVRGVTCSPDGERIATAADDGTVRIWDARTGAELAVFVHEHEGAVLLPDGSYKGDAGPALFWAVKQCRFEVGELDPHYPGIRRLAPEEPLPGVVAS